MSIPKDYQKLKTQPGDPSHCTNYGKQTDSALCYVSVFLVNSNEAMDFNDRDGLIEGIHGALAENQALIEVGAGSKGLIQYIYSIVKTLTENGVLYTLLIHNNYVSHVVAVRGFFEEYGITGIRDATVFELYRREHPDFGPEEWAYDPYDANSQAKFKMIVSEQEKYDELFPDHPLSQCRELVKHVITTL